MDINFQQINNAQHFEYCTTSEEVPQLVAVAKSNLEQGLGCKLAWPVPESCWELCQDYKMANIRKVVVLPILEVKEATKVVG